MEQQLLDALKSGTLDEVGEEMLASRIKVATAELDELVHDFSQKIAKLYVVHQAEYHVTGSTVVLFYKDRLFELLHPEEDKFEVEAITGYSRYIAQARESLNKVEVHK